MVRQERARTGENAASPREQPAHPESEDADYDQVLEGSFPASDPPPGPASVSTPPDSKGAA